MAFPPPKRRTYSEEELYEYGVGALARRMRTVAELKRLLRAARIFRQLARAGFGTSTIFSILKKWDVDQEMLSALEGERE